MSKRLSDGSFVGFHDDVDGPLGCHVKAQYEDGTWRRPPKGWYKAFPNGMSIGPFGSEADAENAKLPPRALN